MAGTARARGRIRIDHGRGRRLLQRLQERLRRTRRSSARPRRGRRPCAAPRPAGATPARSSSRMAPMRMARAPRGIRLGRRRHDHVQVGVLRAPSGSRPDGSSVGEGERRGHPAGAGGPDEGVGVGDAVARRARGAAARRRAAGRRCDRALKRRTLRRHEEVLDDRAHVGLDLGGRAARANRAARAWARPGGSRDSRGARAGETPAPRARSGRGGARRCAASPRRDRDRRAA